MSTGTRGLFHLGEVFINVEVACREASEEEPFARSHVEFLSRRFVP